MKKLLILMMIPLLMGCAKEPYKNVGYKFDEKEGAYRIDVDNDGVWDYKTTNVIIVRQVDSSKSSIFYPGDKLLVIYAKI